MPGIRRLPYAERQLLEQQDAQFLPFPIMPNVQSHHAHLRQMVRLFRNRQSASPCTDLIQYVIALYERTSGLNNQNANLGVACKSGCSYCCSQAVSLTPPEALMVANAVRARPHLMNAVLESARQMQGRDPGRGWPWTNCPLLEQKLCSVYATHPFNCRSFLSLNINDCVKMFSLLGPNNLRGPLVALQAAAECRQLLYAALESCGKSRKSHELIAAVATALAHDDAEERWLKGDDIFAHVPALPNTLSDTQETSIAVMAREIMPTL